jgi:integrase
MSDQTATWNYWANRSVRKIRGVTVSFYKRYENADTLTMDCKVKGQRFQKLTNCPTVKEAESFATMEIRRRQEEGNGMAAARAKVEKGKGSIATIDDILSRLEGGDKVAQGLTLRTYGSSLLRVARIADPVKARTLRLDVVLSEANLLKFYANGQGRKDGVNWKDELDVNGGLNSAVGNLKSLFTEKMIRQKFADLHLPDLEPLRKLSKLPQEAKRFQEWPTGVYEAMHEASLKLKVEQPELWLVNAMLRQLGLRDAELLAARRDWIEVDSATGRAWLVIKNRGTEFMVLKNGRSMRRLELDAELKAVLLPKTGYLIEAPVRAAIPDTGIRATSGDAFWARHDFIYRTHCEWLRAFIPDRKKANHELRMYAGSLVFKRDGLAAAAYFLGHKSVTTTERYYVTWLGDTPMLDAQAVAACGRG